MNRTATSEGLRKPTIYASVFASARDDAALVALAASQHLVVSLSQLRGLGLSDSSVRSRKARSRLHRLHQGVYSLVPREALTRNGHRVAAVLACGPGAVLSHRSAAALHGLRESLQTRIEVTVPARSGRQRPGIQIHHAANLTPADVTVVENIPCTSVARTLFDIAGTVSGRALERAFDRSEMLELFDLRAINDQLARNSTRAGAGAIRRVLEEYYIGSAPTQNEFEEAFYALCLRYRLPQLKVNEWVDLRDGEPMIWADFVWRPQRVIVETDGKKFHDTHQARQRDPRRDQRALVAGWRPLRTTWRQVMRRPQELGPTLVMLLGVSG